MKGQKAWHSNRATMLKGEKTMIKKYKAMKLKQPIAYLHKGELKMEGEKIKVKKNALKKRVIKRNGRKVTMSNFKMIL